MKTFKKLILPLFLLLTVVVLVLCVKAFIDNQNAWDAIIK